MNQRFGQQVQKRRIYLGISFQRLCTRAGISQGILSRIENGKGNPTLNTMEKIAKALRTTIASLL
jgi:transcriptional regulator with XRE-family HTH domain